TKNVTAEPLVIDLSDTPVVANERTNPLIVFPQQPAGNSVTMKIHDSDNQNYTCELKFGENGLVAGNNYLFTITVKKTSLEVNSTITDWQTEENDESVAKSDDTDDESEEPEVPEAEE
ncbi:MAG: fimbrillin family protein, partial [Muribaculaceae bacterium]|nr:fimbrillin family protein [Muribaculaceae bacterium]